MFFPSFFLSFFSCLSLILFLSVFLYPTVFLSDSLVSFYLFLSLSFSPFLSFCFFLPLPSSLLLARGRSSGGVQRRDEAPCLSAALGRINHDSITTLMTIHRCFSEIEPSGVSDPSCADSGPGRQTHTPGPGIHTRWLPTCVLRCCVCVCGNTHRSTRRYRRTVGTTVRTRVSTVLRVPSLSASQPRLTGVQTRL